MDFDVLMSTYIKEHPEFLRASLKSILTQKVKPNNIILVCDGPLSQELNNVIQECEDNLLVVRLKRRVDLSKALNFGLKYVKSSYVARMDSDDICAPNRFKKEIDFMLKNPEAAVVGGQVKEFDCSIGNIVGERIVPTTFDEILKYAPLRNPMNHPTVMFKVDKIKEVGGYPDVEGFEDYALWVNLLIHDNIILNSNDVYVYMRTNDDTYRRRGGFSYLKRYIKMKKGWYKLGFIKYSDLIKSSMAMSFNILIPSSFRKKLYRKILHRKIR